jgi:hypothetical protein
MALALGGYSVGASICFEFGNGCLRIWNEGKIVRRESTYAVPSGWATSFPRPKITHFECWRVTM